MRGLVVAISVLAAVVVLAWRQHVTPAAALDVALSSVPDSSADPSTVTAARVRPLEVLARLPSQAPPPDFQPRRERHSPWGKALDDELGAMMASFDSEHQWLDDEPKHVVCQEGRDWCTIIGVFPASGEQIYDHLVAQDFTPTVLSGPWGDGHHAVGVMVSLRALGESEIAIAHRELDSLFGIDTWQVTEAR